MSDTQINPRQTVGVELALPKDNSQGVCENTGRASSAPTSPEDKRQTVGVELALPKTDPQNLFKQGQSKLCPYIVHKQK